MKNKAEQIVTVPRKGELYLGVEIECLLRGTSIDVELGRIASVYDKQGAVIYGKHDGTISNNIESDMPPVVGVELVTQPMTIDCYHNRTWKTIFERMVIPKNYNKSTLGGHIHISKDFFSITQLYKILKFLRTNYQYMQYVGGRDVNSNNYCRLQQTTGSSAFQIKHKMPNQNRYETVNVTSFGTVELRFFASPRIATELYKNVEWCHALAHYCKEAPLIFTVKDFHTWLFSHKEKDGLYKNIVTFLTTPPVKRVWHVNAEEVISTPTRPDYYEDECDDDSVTCCSCNSNIDTRHDNYSNCDDGALCEDCRFWCYSCEEYHPYSSRIIVYDADDDPINICPSCARQDTDHCNICNERHYTDDLYYVTNNDNDDTRRACPNCLSDIESSEEEEEEDIPTEDEPTPSTIEMVSPYIFDYARVANDLGLVTGTSTGRTSSNNAAIQSTVNIDYINNLYTEFNCCTCSVCVPRESN